ncbi:MAG: arginase family protein [Candidatus Pacearchaeota archaeon]
MAFIVRVPGINGLGKTEGCEKAGVSVLEALNKIHSNESGVPIDVRLFDLEEIHLDNSDLKLTNDLIYKNSLEMFETKPKTIFLGGDHSISYSLTRAFFEHCKDSEKEPCLIVFDSRPDCKKKEGDFPSNEEWLRSLIESGFPSENIFLVGARNFRAEEISFLKEKGVKIMKVNQIIENIDDSCDILMEFSSGKEVYLSIDIGVVDPAYAPGTSGKEPGGLTSRQLIYFLQRINRVRALRAVDIVEINPKEDFKGMTVKLGAKILGELV